MESQTDVISSCWWAPVLLAFIRDRMDFWWGGVSGLGHQCVSALRKHYDIEKKVVGVLGVGSIYIIEKRRLQFLRSLQKYVLQLCYNLSREKENGGHLIEYSRLQIRIQTKRK